MKKFIISTLLKLVIQALLKNASVQQVLALAEDAQKSHENNMSRKAHVYRELKKVEPTETPLHVLNTLVEMGVTLYKMHR